MEQDGLYINGNWVSDAEEFRATYQGNDLTKPATLQTSYTNGLALPDSLAVRRLTGGAEAPDSGGGTVYQGLPAYVHKAGEQVFTGRTKWERFAAGWSVSLVEERGSVFEQLNRSIRTADLSRLNFTWNVDTIAARRAATEGVVFPLIDYGTLQEGRQPNDLLLPAVYLKTVLEQMAGEAGYRVTGLADVPEYQQAILPHAEEKPVARDAQFVADRQARATVPVGGAYGINRTGRIDAVLPLTVVDRPLSGFSQGSAGNYKPALAAYKCDVPMRVVAAASISYKLKVSVGGVRVSLILEKNGVEVTWEAREETGVHDPLFVQVETLSHEALVDCRAGDVLTWRLVADNYTTVNVWFFECNRDETMWASFAPDGEVRYGDEWPVAANLPNLTGVDLLRLAALAFCGTWSVHTRRRELRFVPFTPLTKDKAGAADWSAKVDEGAEGTLTPSIEPYARLNRLTYKPTDGVTTGYGDGSLAGGAGEAETTLFELSVSATQVSTRTAAGIDVVPLVEIRTADDKGQVTAKATNARLLLVHPAATATVTTLIGETLTPTPVVLRLCWFDRRPAALASEPPLSLAFAALILRYYEGLAVVLRRPRMVEVSVYLRPADIAGLDFARLVYLSNTRAGSLRLASGYYYLNKISGYKPGQPVTANLIAI